MSDDFPVSPPITETWRFGFGPGTIANLKRLRRIEDNLGLGDPVDVEKIRVERTHWGQYVYYGSFVVSFGKSVRRPGDGVILNRMWANDELIYDAQKRFLKPAHNFRFRVGSETDDQNYKDLITVTFRGMRLTDYGDSLPAISAELIDAPGNGGATLAGEMVDDGRWGPIVDMSGSVWLDDENDSLMCIHAQPSNGLPAGVFSSVYRLSSKGNTVSPPIKGATRHNGADFVNPDANNFYTWATYKPAENMIVGGWSISNALDELKVLRTFHLDDPRQEVDTFENGFTVDGGVLFTILSGQQITTVIAACNSKDGLINFVPCSAYRFHPALGLIDVSERLVALAVANSVSSSISSDGYTNVFAATTTKVYKIAVGPGPDSPINSLAFEAPGDILRIDYDEPQDRLIVVYKDGATDAKLASINADGTVAFTTAAFPAPPDRTFQAANAEASSNLAGASLVLPRAAAALTHIDLETGEVGIAVLPNIFPAFDDNRNAFIWDSVTQSIYTANMHVYRLGFAGETVEPVDPADRINGEQFFRAWAKHVGFDDAEVTTIDMDTFYIDGYLVSSGASLASISTELGYLYGFDWTEQNGKLIYRALYNADNSITIDAEAEDVAYLAEGYGDGDVLDWDRASDLKLPLKLSLSYFNRQKDYLGDFQIAERNGDPTPTQGAEEPVDWSLPVTITSEDAIAKLYAALYRMWAGKIGYAVRLPPEFMKLDPTDIIRVTADGFIYEAQIATVRLNADNSVEVALTEVNPSRHPVAVPIEPGAIVVSSQTTPARVVILDIPNLRQSQDDPNRLNWVVIATAQPGQTTGAVNIDLTRSQQGTTKVWEPRLSFAATELGYVGTLRNTLDPYENWFSEDGVNSLFLTQDTIPDTKLVNATDGELDAGANLIAVGDYRTGTELIQFKNCEETSPGVWRLWNLRRGRFGTEVFMGDQYAGAPVAFLDNAKIMSYQKEDYDSQTTFLWRSMSPGQADWQAQELSIVGKGYSRKPYAPIDLEVVRPTATGDVDISFTLRPRFWNYPPDTLPTFSLPGTDALAGQVVILNPNGEGVARRLPVAGDSVSYGYTELVEDGYDGLDYLNIYVQQLAGATVDWGFSAGGNNFPIVTLDEQTTGIQLGGGGTFEVGLVAVADPGAIYVQLGNGGEFVPGVTMPGIISNLNLGLGGDFAVDLERAAEITVTLGGGGEFMAEVTAEEVVGFERWRVRFLTNAGGPSQNTALRQLAFLTAPVNLGGERLDQSDGVYLSSGMEIPDTEDGWFDRVVDFNWWLLVGSGTPWMEYQFPEPVEINAIGFESQTGQSPGWPLTAAVEYWDGTQWVISFQGSTNITGNEQYRELVRSNAFAAPVMEGYTQNEDESDGTSTTVPATGVVAGELLVLHVGFGIDVDLASVAVSHGFVIPSNGRLEDGRAVGIVAYKIASASEPASYDITWTGSTSTVATLARWSGASGVLDIVTNSQVGNTQTITYPAGSVVDTLASRYMVSSGGWGDGVVTANEDLTAFSPDVEFAWNGQTSGNSNNATTVVGWVQEGIILAPAISIDVNTPPHSGLYWESWSIVIEPGEADIPGDNGGGGGGTPSDPALVGSTTVTQTGNTDIVIPVPVGTAVGDLMIVHVGNNGGGSIQNASSTGSGAWTFRRPSALNGLFSEFHKVATAGDIGGSVTIDAAPASRTLPAIANLSVFHATEPGHTTWDVIGNLGGSNNNVAPSKLANAGDVIVCGSVANAQATAVPSGMTELARAGGAGLGVAVAYKVVPAGNTGPQSFAYAGGTTFHGASTTLIRSKP